MCDNTVSGYKNWETFTVSLDIDNNQGNYEYWQETGREFIDPDKLGDAIRESYEESLPDGLTGVFSDMLQASLDAVDWREVGEGVLNSVSENDDPYFDRFDVAEAWYLFLTAYHDGNGAGKTSYDRLSRLLSWFKPGSSVDAGDLSDNGREIYRQLVRRHAGGF